MEIIYPKYYEEFQCIASACPDSCCKEWEVDVDDASAAYYRSLDSDLGDALREVLKDTEDGAVMTIRDGRCPMWRTDGLCRIQAALGHDALCKTCREFPRLRHDYGDFEELGLELSCPEAAHLILTRPNELCVRQTSGGEEPEYDLEVMAILRRSRNVVLSYLETTKLPTNLALGVILVYAHHVQNWLDGGEEAVFDQTAGLALMEEHAKTGDWDSLVAFFKNLEILTPHWKQRLETPAQLGIWNKNQRELAVYFIVRHWLQAVSDYDLVGRVKFIIAACLLIHRLGGDFEQTAQLFSKEIENDLDNLEAIFDGAYMSPALTDLNLLSLLKSI